VLPYDEHLGTGVSTGQQIFNLSGTFTIPWVQANAPYTISLLGEVSVVDIDAPICEGGGILLCDELPESSFEALRDEVRIVMSKYLKLMNRLTRSDDSTRRFKKAARRFYKRTLNLLVYTPVAYQCPPEQSLAPDCEITSIPKEQLLTQLDKLFSKNPPNGRGERTIERLRKRMKRRLQRKINELFPDDYWSCPE
jgi:hypothetical protein